MVPFRFVTPVYVNTLYATVSNAANCGFYLISDKTPMSWRYIREVIKGLEKLTNANLSVSTGNAISGRTYGNSRLEVYVGMLHSNFGKKMTRAIGGNFGAYTFILPLPYFLNICLPFWVFYQRKEYLNKIKIL